MNNYPHSTIIQEGNVIYVNNAFVEDVSYSNNFSGYIIVSYLVEEKNNIACIQRIRLNITQNTTIFNSLRQCMYISNIHAGMQVDVIFSSRMTASIPPQANTYLVVI